MSKGNLTVWDCLHIREILDDPILLRVWLVDGDKAKYVFVNSVDGKITFGRTPYKWLNWIFKDTKEVSFTDFAFKTANALAGQSKNRNTEIFRGISEVVLDKAIADDDYHYVVDALFDTFRYGWEGKHQSKFIDMRNDTKVKEIEVEVPDLPRYKGRSTRIHGLEKIGEIRLNSGEVLDKVVCRYSIQE